MPDQFLALVPSGVPHSQTGPQHVVGEDSIPKVRTNDNENGTICVNLGRRAPIHFTVKSG